MTLNDDQRKIAETTDGIIVVDAGPGTGKTHTIVQRYVNILNKNVDPSDILLLTFTNNAATEMEERVKSEMISSPHNAKAGSVRSSTFDSFCLKVVMESPETISGFFKTKETLTRNAKLVQNETLDEEYFRNVYTKFIRRYGKMYGSIPAIVGTSYADLYDLVQKLMSIGVVPTHDGGWFGYDTGVLLGRPDELVSALRTMSKEIDGDYKKQHDVRPDMISDHVTDEMMHIAAEDARKELLAFINGVYYEFIRSSVADNRLTFGLNALFAFVSLYSNKNIRKMMSFRYVMVDEFQDTNELQFMISLLILKEPNLCAVGDWKQGIYGFRYASIENITKFEERLVSMRKFLNKGERRTIPGIADAIRLPLTENYRSTQNIINTAFSSLRCRTHDKEKIDETWLNDNVTELKAVRDDGHTRTERICAPDSEKEIIAILQKIEDYVNNEEYTIVEHKDGTVKERRPLYSDIAVLCRNGAMCTAVKEAASEYGIPAHLQGDMSIMGTREGKLALAWLRYVNNRNDIRGPVTILADAEYKLAKLRSIFPERHGTDGVPESLSRQRKALMRKRTRMNDLLTSIFQYHGLNNDITQSIISTVSKAHSGNMLTVADTIRLIESDMKRSSKYNVDALLDDRSVMIQTMHKSKGLEYPIVIIGGLNTSVMPSSSNRHGLFVFDPLYGVRITREYAVENERHRIYDCWKWCIIKNISGPDRDGERRLFFVALSRAKQYITMTCRRGRESMFIKDIGGDALKMIEPSLEK
ncbi:MAG: ATP-dependent helicase, partial [Methanomassiliicoccaceae archaeon]|nr:ATP-dependent helicase [Methanomassiliicoccaceae archaeon]